MLLISLPSALRFIRLNVFGHSPCGALIHPIFDFKNSHYINITPVFKAKTRTKISYPKFVNLFLHRSLNPFQRIIKVNLCLCIHFLFAIKKI